MIFHGNIVFFIQVHPSCYTITYIILLLDLINRLQFPFENRKYFILIRGDVRLFRSFLFDCRRRLDPPHFLRWEQPFGQGGLFEDSPEFFIRQTINQWIYGGIHENQIF